MLEVMAGWKDEDLIFGLIKLKKLSRQRAQTAQWNCGGRLRLALDYLDDKNAVTHWPELVIADASAAECKIKIAVNARDSRTSSESIDRLRIVFQDNPWPSYSTS